MTLCSLFDDFGRDILPLVDKALGVAPISTWDALLQASSVLCNAGTWIRVPYAFESNCLSCVVNSGYLAKHLVARCIKALRPLLNLSRVDSSSCGVLEIETCLGNASFFDALSFFAVLASPHLQSELKRSSQGFDLELIYKESTGLHSTMLPSRYMVGRQDEIEILNRHIRPVFESSFNMKNCPLVLVHGNPGVGKSFTTLHVLNCLQNEFQAIEGESCWESVEMYSWIILGRGRHAVRDSLHKMGLVLCDKLGLGSSASADDILRCLHDFLLYKRFVIVADDCDTEGCRELLFHIPQSTKPCALVITSMFGFDMISQLEYSSRKSDLVCVYMECFTPELSLQLVNAVCNPYIRESLPAPVLFWMMQVFEELGQLPLGVSSFANALRQELITGVTLDIFAAKWRDLIIGQNPLLEGTVRLALHQLNALSPDMKEACVQLLGLLALCPAQVPWSLFDGLCLSLVSATGQPCQVRSEDGNGGALFDDAAVAFDDAIEGGKSVNVQLHDGKEIIVARSRVSFGPHIIGMVVKNERYQLQVLTPQPYMRGARVFIEEATKTSNVLLGRVLQFHNDDCTLSVVFGCETGASSMLATIALFVTFVQAR
jgi:hypothetical protein